MLSRSKKAHSPIALLLSTLGGALLGMAFFSGPAMAFSLNPDAGSPGIEKVNDFHTIAFILIVIAVVVVNLAILRAVRPRHRHDPSAGDGSRGPGTLRVGIGLAAIALAVFVTATVFSDKAREVPASTETVAGLTADKQLEIQATGQQWLWRFEYPNRAFSFHRLVVPTGITVALKLSSIDVVHGWNVPSLTGKADAIPGQSNWVYFRADEEGTYEGRSSIFSGQGYDTMATEVEAVSPAEYESYVTRLRQDIQAAQDTVEKEIGRSET